MWKIPKPWKITVSSQGVVILQLWELPLVGSPKSNWSLLRGQTKHSSETSMMLNKNLDLCTCSEGYWDPTLEPYLGKGSVGERLVAEPLSLGSGWAQPKRGTWVCPPVGQPPTVGAIEVQCYVDRVAGKSRGLGGLIPSR